MLLFPLPLPRLALGGVSKGEGLWSLPLALSWEFPLAGAGNLCESARHRRALSLLSEIMTAARRNSKLFIKGNDRFDLMKADFIT